MRRRKGSVFLIFILSLLLGWLIFYVFGLVKEESYRSMCERNFLIVNSEEIVTLEAGSDLSISSGGLKEEKNIPLQIKHLIVSYPDGVTLTCADIDMNKLGVQEIPIGSVMSDSFGQNSYVYRNIYIDIQDTVEPIISLQQGEIVCDGTFNSIKNNVVSVTDAVYGEYVYDEQLSNHSWRINTHRMNYLKKGRYTATVEVNDNGKIVEKEFDVIIDKNRSSVYR